MAFSIRSARVEQKARAYAARHGITLTGALERALDKAVEQDDNQQDAAFQEWIEPIRAMQAAAARAPDTGISEEAIMGWDAHGLPT